MYKTKVTKPNEEIQEYPNEQEDLSRTKLNQQTQIPKLNIIPSNISQKLPEGSKSDRSDQKFIPYLQERDNLGYLQPLRQKQHIRFNQKRKSYINIPSPLNSHQQLSKLSNCVSYINHPLQKTQSSLKKSQSFISKMPLLQIPTFQTEIPNTSPKTKTSAKQKKHYIAATERRKIIDSICPNKYDVFSKVEAKELEKEYLKKIHNLDNDDDNEAYIRKSKSCFNEDNQRKLNFCKKLTSDNHRVILVNTEDRYGYKEGAMDFCKLFNNVNKNTYLASKKNFYSENRLFEINKNNLSNSEPDPLANYHVDYKNQEMFHFRHTYDKEKSLSEKPKTKIPKQKNIDFNKTIFKYTPPFAIYDSYQDRNVRPRQPCYDFSIPKSEAPATRLDTSTSKKVNHESGQNYEYNSGKLVNFVDRLHRGNKEDQVRFENQNAKIRYEERIHQNYQKMKEKSKKFAIKIHSMELDPIQQKQAYAKMTYKLVNLKKLIYSDFTENERYLKLIGKN